MKAFLYICALLLAFCGGILCTSCESQQTKQARAIKQHQAAALAQARADSTAATAHVDSATTYRQRQHALRPTAADTTALRRFFSNYFGW